MAEIESLFAVGKFREAVDEQVGTMIHEWFIVNKRAHRVQAGEALSSIGFRRC